MTPKQKLREWAQCEPDNCWTWEHNRYVMGHPTPNGYRNGYHEPAAWLWGITGDLEPERTIYWSDLDQGWKPRERRLDGTSVRMYAVPYTAHGDYVGSHCESSNHNELMEQFAESFGVAECIGGYDSRCTMIAVDYVTNEEAEQLLEILEGLQNHPLINEERMSEEELEYADGDGWEHFGGYDWQRALREHFGADHDETADTLIDNLSTEEGRALYYTATERAEYRIEFEAYQSPLYRFEDMVEQLTLDDLKPKREAI